MLRDRLVLKGSLDITLKRDNGEVVTDTVDNLVVTIGRNHIADQLAAKTEAGMSHMAIGSGSATAVVADAALGTEISRKAVSSKLQGAGASANKIVYAATWPAGEGTGAISEAGIFNAAAAGAMLNRATFAVKNKGAGDSLSIQWTLTISG